MSNSYSRYIPEIYKGVVEDNNDEMNIGRCKVRVFGIHGDPENKESLIKALPWALPITPFTVNRSRGCVNIPDVGDIVWVMFECGEKTRPLYFGGFYSKGDIPVDKDKTVIYTDTGNEISYDRNSKTYTITVSGASTITLNNGNINITSPSVTINGETEVSGNATIHGDLTCDGTGYFEDLFVNGSSWIPGGVDQALLEGMSEEELEELLKSIEDDPNSFLYDVQEIKALMAAKGIAYDQNGYVQLEIAGQLRSVRTDCSGLVGAMVTQYLVKHGYSYEQAKSMTPSYSGAYLNANIPGFTKVAVTPGMEIPAGSVAVRNGHVEVYGGKSDNGSSLVWSGGSTNSLNSPGLTTASNAGYDYIFVPEWD